METREFKLFFKNKSPILYTYLLNEVITASVAENLLAHIFAKFYRLKMLKPESLSNEKWLLLITKKTIVDYYGWRITEEGQAFEDTGRTSYQSSILVEKYQKQLNAWISELSEQDQSIVNDYILTELPPVQSKTTLKEKIQRKIQEVSAKHGKK